MSSRALDRLRELQAEGVSFSRNKNFALFENPTNREALSLHRYLDALAEEIQEGHDHGALGVSLVSPDHGPVRLELLRRDLGVKHAVNLQPEELMALGDRLEVRAILAGYGVEVPKEGS